VANAVEGANQTTHPTPPFSSIQLRGGHVSSYKRCKNLIPHRCSSSELYLLVFSRGPDTIVCRLSVHGGSRNVLDLASYVINDGQLFGARGKRIRNRFVGSHFSFFISVW
jgi:hypothetical protein